MRKILSVSITDSPLDEGICPVIQILFRKVGCCALI